MMFLSLICILVLIHFHKRFTDNLINNRCILPGQVNYALGALYYVCNESNKVEVLKPEVIDVIKRYAAAEEVSVSFSNLAKAFLDKHLSGN
jgi:predicted membrane channel-forming protein YqfA (hemolysin III family)